MNGFKVFLFLVVITFIIGFSMSEDYNDWLMYGHDAMSTGMSFNNGFNKGGLIWKYKYLNLTYGFATPIQPIIADGYVYYMAINGNLTKISINGSVVFNKKVADTFVIDTPVFYLNKIYFGDINGIVYGYDENGNLACKYNISNIVRSTVVYNGLIIVGSDNAIYVLNSNCQKIWEYKINETGQLDLSQPSVYDGILVLYDEHGVLHAFNVYNGKSLFNYTPSSNYNEYVVGPPLIYKGIVYYPNVNDGGLFAVYINNGTLDWYKQLNGYPNSPSVYNGIIILRTDKIYALNYSNGNVIWTSNLGIAGNKFSITYNGLAYALSGNSDTGYYIHVINVTNGNDIYDFNVISKISPIAIYGNSIYFSDWVNNTLYRYGFIKPDLKLEINCGKNNINEGKDVYCDIYAYDNVRLTNITCNGKTIYINDNKYNSKFKLDTSSTGTNILKCTVYDKLGNSKTKIFRYNVIGNKITGGFIDISSYNRYVVSTISILSIVTSISVYYLYRKNIINKQ